MLTPRLGYTLGAHSRAGRMKSLEKTPRLFPMAPTNFLACGHLGVLERMASRTALAHHNIKGG